MKISLGILIYALMGLAIVAGILLLIAGKPWLLIAALVAYIAAFSKFGCLTH